MPRFHLGDPRGHFSFKHGDAVGFKTAGGHVDPENFGRIVDGWQDGQVSGSRSAPVYKVEIDGHPGTFFNAEDLQLQKLSREDLIRLKIHRRWRQGYPRYLVVAERLAPGQNPTLIPAFGPGTGHLCAACDDPISPSEIQATYPRSQGDPVRLHERCDQIWREEE